MASPDYAPLDNIPVTLKASLGNPLECDYRPFYFGGSWDSYGNWDSTWSAPLIEVWDNGFAPDSAAGDGIFTGRVQLAQDSVHLYQWSIYYENFSDTCYKLQNGSAFHVLGPEPPNISIINVNPSGSEHNWIYTLIGDHDINQDLTQGLYGFPYNWNTTISLTIGVNYHFRWVVMHSNIGWPCRDSVSFIPDISCIYNFVLNDRDNTLSVMECDSAAYRIHLYAESRHDHYVPIWCTFGDTNMIPILSKNKAMADFSPSGQSSEIPPRITDTEVSFYTLYRDSLPNPFWRRPSTKCIPYFNRPDSVYEDWVRLDGDSIRNGVTYYYQLSSVYDIGGGHYLEIVEANQATATPQNLQPSAPFNLSGTVNDRDVHLNWSFINTAHDLDHFIIYKRFVSDSIWTQAGVATDSSFILNIPPGDDGLIAFEISAVDNGQPPLESDYSNQIILLIGIPPGCQYIAGDINANGQVNGVDIVYAVNYFKGFGAPPLIDCFPFCLQTPNPFFAAGDVNSSCTFNGIDITYFVRYLKLQVANLIFCPDCPPTGR